MSNTFEKVVAVISKNPDLRQDFEIQSLLPWLRKKSQLFSQLKTDFLKDIVRNCGLVSYKKDDIIIRQGERGDCFYIILEGRIGIYILNKDKDEDGDEQKALSEIGAKTHDGKLDKSKLGNYVCPLGSGVPFGEVALMSDDCIRTATIIAEENTDLLVVDRALYTRCVKDVLAKEFEDKVDFIRNNPLFSNWAPRYRKQLSMALYKETFPYETVLVRQGEPVNNIYFIISGQVEIQTDPAHHPLQYPKIFIDAEDNEVEKLIKRAEKVRPPTETQYSANLKKKDATKNTKLCYLGKNESVGDLEVLLDIDTYMQTAVCTELTEVLVLEMKHYERLFVRRHPRTIDAMRELLKVKLETRRSLLTKQEDIPFLRHLQNRILSMNAPKVTDKKSKVLDSVSAAEKEFLNHKGPLIDTYGPGSVWYVIRERDKMKKRMNAHREKMKIRQPPTKPVGHVHTIRLPQTLLMAAQMAGATQEIDVLMEKLERNENLKPLMSSSPRPTSTRSSDARVARSFRKILSAHRAASEERRPETDTAGSESETEQARSLPDTRQTAISFMEEKEDASLSFLEEKVRKWLCADNPNPKGGANVVQLRRLPVQDMGEPKPGHKIVLRKRRLSITNDGNKGGKHTNNKARNSPDNKGHGHYKILVQRPRRSRSLRVDRD